MRPLPLAAAVVAIAFVTFYQFPGHTWLQQDSQIYTPILEHLRDPSLLRNDVLVQRPHVSFTLYDEIALGLRGLTGLGFRTVLAALQIGTRALGIWGLYLMGTATGLSAVHALIAAAIVSLGAHISGPQVLTLEYEPIPRGFAVPLQVCAVGLAAHGRFLGAGIVAAAGFLIHPPTVYPFWAVYFVLALWPAKPEVMKRRLAGLACLFGAVLVLWGASRMQAGEVEGQVFFSLLTPLQEQMQRVRASYIWISIWGPQMWLHWVLVCALFAAAYARISRRLPLELRLFVLGLAGIGLLSVPVSWLLLERIGWALIPQFQPMRALLFVVLMTQFSSAAAALAAVEANRRIEALAWFAVAFLVPLMPRVDQPGLREWSVDLLLAALVAGAAFVPKAREWAMAAAAMAAFWVTPWLGGVMNYPSLRTPELRQLSDWARASTPRDAVFLFPDAGKALDPGIFRSEALRAVYVDWKGGGQVNYLKELGEQWWFRWQQIGAGTYTPMEPAKYGALGIGYIVLRPDHRQQAWQPAFENAKYLAYRIP